MPSVFPALHLVGDPASERATAVRAAYPAALHRGSIDIGAAKATPGVGAEVLVLLSPNLEDFQAAIATCDQRGLPRWAVVPPVPEEVEYFAASPAAWEASGVTRAVACAQALHTLRRDNARLSGDLCTVARRLTHDLRTPLNSISTANESLAANALAPEPAPTLHRAISAAVDDSGRLIERVALVLLAGTRRFVGEPVDMEEIVWRARERLDARIRSAGATISSPAKWPMVDAVPEWLELIWTNLLANCLDHAGGNVRIDLGWECSDAATGFWVRDSGGGVPLAKRHQLFHPFDRLNELNAPRGYGLSLVQRLIELQGGTTAYSPEPAPGGSFGFTLPIPQAT